MISKSIFVKLLTNSLSSSSQVRHVSMTSRALAEATKSGYQNYCYAIAKQSDHKRLAEFYKENFICKDPLVRALYPCEIVPDEIKRFHITEISCPVFTILLKDRCNQKIIGVAVNSLLKKDDDRICKFLAMKSCVADHNLKKYFQVLSQLYQTPMLHRQLNVNEIVKVSPSVAENISPDIVRSLIQMSFNVATSKGFTHASVHSTTAQTRYAAELLKCDKFWSKCYHDALTQQSFKPPSIPKPPNDALSVHVKNLNEMWNVLRDLMSHWNGNWIKWKFELNDFLRPNLSLNLINVIAQSDNFIHNGRTDIVWTWWANENVKMSRRMSKDAKGEIM